MKFDIRVCQAIKIHRFQTLHQKHNLLDKICWIKKYKETVWIPVEAEQTAKG